MLLPFHVYLLAKDSAVVGEHVISLLVIVKNLIEVTVISLLVIAKNLIEMIVISLLVIAKNLIEVIVISLLVISWHVIQVIAVIAIAIAIASIAIDVIAMILTAMFDGHRQMLYSRKLNEQLFVELSYLFDTDRAKRDFFENTLQLRSFARLISDSHSFARVKTQNVLHGIEA